MIMLSDVTVRFGSRVILDNVSLHFPKNRTTAILGPNGRGKTTLLRTLLGQQKMNSGLRHAPKIVGYVPQAVMLAHPYSALDIVVMGRAASLGLFGRPDKKEQNIALEAMARVGVAHLTDTPFLRLSGGERQLVLLARAIATGADVLILDEPAAALDLHNEMRLLDILTDISQESDKSIIFTTHNPNHALNVADDVLMMMPDGSTIHGTVNETLKTDNLTRLYGVDMQFIRLDNQAEEQSLVIPSFSLCRKCPAASVKF
ncbi:ABC transporter ATP-binding protein [Microvirga sp. W0021]|uniref:ABC transporter ATP-binding protein n=1 Tax=Hohaiivirga grylli TaxID=3133970 RepID=A0ABV0BHN2_9HYPH